MTDWLALSFAFILGWAGCCIFIALAEWLTDLRDEQSFPDPMAEPHGDNCAWPTDFERPHSTRVTEGVQPDHGAR